MLHELEPPSVIKMIEEASDVCVKHIVHLPFRERDRECVQRLMLAAARSEAIREAKKILLVNLVEDGSHRLLDDLVLQRSDSQRALPPVRFLDIYPSRGFHLIRPTVYTAVQVDESTLQPRRILLPPDTIHPGSRSSL